MSQRQQAETVKGFSLTELAVVLGMIGVLAAVLLPVIFSSQENARRTTCASNMRQIGHAFSMYVSDYDGVFPGAISGSTQVSKRHLKGEAWTKNLFAYTGKKYLVCPDRELPGRFTPSKAKTKMPDPWELTGYAMNYCISEEVPTDGQSRVVRVDGKAERMFRYPALTILVFDVRTGILTMSTPDVFPWPRSPEWREKWRVLRPLSWGLADYHVEIRAQSGGATRHSGGANYVFADGHVKWLKPEQISPAPKNDGVHPGFGL